ncbi:MAG: glycosyltransferase family 4 protein [Candidatus Sulfotelmatobacter sp.]
MDERVRLLFVPELKEDLIPNADAIFATGWQTAEPVVDFPASKGEKFYLIQHYEACIGPKHLVDATWKLPLRKVVVSKWLRDIGRALVGEDVAYIPNAIDHEHYRMIRPIEGRPPQVAMMFSKMPFKGSSDGVDAIRAARERHPRLRAVLFGTSRLKPRLPRWIEYHNNPPQDFIVEEIYNRSSVYLCPSISEGFALPPAEAAACGCAIVATDNGGIRDFIEPGVTGMLSPPRDSRALADGISLLVENEDLRVRLAKACNSFVRRLDWEQNTSTLEGLLQSISPELKGA